jgi:tetratricopeptide (TPR) repeat protein
VKPVATIQDGVYVYQGEFAVPLMSALVDVRKTGELLNLGQPAAALAMAQQAVELAPNSAKTQINLADALSTQQRWSEALQHYESAETLARTVRPELEDEDILPRSKGGIEVAEAHLHQR